MSQSKRHLEVPQGIKWSNKKLLVTTSTINMKDNRLEAECSYTTGVVDTVYFCWVLRGPLVEIIPFLARCYVSLFIALFSHLQLWHFDKMVPAHSMWRQTFHTTCLTETDAALLIETNQRLDVGKDDIIPIIVQKYASYDSYSHRRLGACRSVRCVCLPLSFALLCCETVLCRRNPIWRCCVFRRLDVAGCMLWIILIFNKEFALRRASEEIYWSVCVSVRIH